MVLIFLSSLYADLHMFVTCFSMERVSVSVTPRFLAAEVGVMSELPIDIEYRRRSRWREGLVSRMDEKDFRFIII